MRVSISDVWDRTTAVISGRPGMLATIAALLAFLPLAIQSAILLQLKPGTAIVPGTPISGAAAATMVRFGLEMIAIGALIAILSLWGSLALVAASTSPSVTSAGQAIAMGARRLPVMAGLALLIFLGLIGASIPLGFVLGLVGAGLGRATGGVPAGAGMGPTIMVAALLTLVLLGLILWVFARLILLVPVVLNERAGIGSFARSWSLTRGMVWRLMGTLLLFLIVYAVASGAMQAVVGLLARLALGPDHIMAATLIGQLAAVAVGAAFSVVLSVFSAQLYAALTGWGVAAAFE